MPNFRRDTRLNEAVDLVATGRLLFNRKVAGSAQETAEEEERRPGQPTSVLTEAVSSARPFLASAKNIEVFGLV